MKVLIGTTNPSKVKRFEELLSDCEIEFLTLRDLGITEEPEETGSTPEENAVLKAKFYGKFFDVVICNDSGLYFEELDINDDRQPGLNIRTPKSMKRLEDEEMITYYATLIASLGGKVSAYYLDGMAVYNKGRVSSFMDKESAVRCSSFFMVDKPSEKRHEGWPLDSLSKYKDIDEYFVDKTIEDSKESIIVSDYKEKIVAFLKESLK
ncbi:MAG: non-canonical purine NTP pyrophosphatase [Agathobacter sp.]